MDLKDMQTEKSKDGHLDKKVKGTSLLLTHFKKTSYEFDLICSTILLLVLCFVEIYRFMISVK